MILLELMGVLIACMPHAEELLDIGADGYSTNILMVKDDRQHELHDLSDITLYEDVFEPLKGSLPAIGNVLTIELEQG